MDSGGNPIKIRVNIDSMRQSILSRAIRIWILGGQSFQDLGS